jgi:hypothetical protein
MGSNTAAFVIYRVLLEVERLEIVTFLLDAGVNLGGSGIAKAALKGIGFGFFLERGFPLEAASIARDANVIFAGRRAVVLLVGGEREFAFLIGDAGSAGPMGIGFSRRLEHDQGADHRLALEKDLAFDREAGLAAAFLCAGGEEAR